MKKSRIHIRNIHEYIHEYIHIRVFMESPSYGPAAMIGFCSV